MQTIQDTVLIVDDDPHNLRVLADTLEDAGYRVRVDRQGEAAIAAAQAMRPDLILLDVMMPGIDGFETCRRLKQDERTADIPVIFMTALNDAIDEVKGLELGAVDYITKPFQLETVLARLRTHLTIHKLQQRLERQNAELDAFAHTVAHDLMNPLGSMLTNAEYLSDFLEMMDPEEMVQIARNIHLSGRKATNIIHEIMVLTGVRKEEVEMWPIEMGDVVAQASQRLDLMIRDYEAEIVLPEHWPMAMGHAPWLEEVWVNYLSNALKYGGRPPRVELGATLLADGQLCFWARDNGEGLSEAEQARLFTEFTRLSEVRVQGHGLGLSIVRRIMDKLGGQAGVKSEVGKGATFYFTLPATPDVALHAASSATLDQLPDSVANNSTVSAK